jgi:hypothetical protein
LFITIRAGIFVQPQIMFCTRAECGAHDIPVSLVHDNLCVHGTAFLLS